MRTIFTVLILGLVFSSMMLSQTITSAASGNWSSTSTWTGGSVPTSTNDVQIAAGHTVIIDDANAVCNSMTFGDATAHLAMGSSSSVLSVYGNMTLATLAGSGATATAVLTGDAISAINVTAGGSGYVAVVVAITLGGGSGASATGVLSGGVVTSVTLNSGGSGYTSTPTVNIYPTHALFTSWAAGAKIKFTGTAATQTLSGWGPNAFSTSFDSIVVDKSSGKVVAGAGTNMRFGIGSGLDVVAGTFELGSTDDIEGRTFDGSPSSPVFVIRSGATFNMVGGASHIRRSSNTGEESSKIGKLTVYGTATLGAASSNRVNFSGIDVESGGIVEMATGKSTAAGDFNPGLITVKNGGTFKNSLSTTAFWYNNVTTPPSVTVNSGGEYECAATSTTIPQGGITQNSGSTFRFSSGSATTLPAAITSYKNLILSGAGSKTLGVNTTIEEALQLSGSFTTLGLNSFTLTYNSGAVLRFGASGQATAQTTHDTEWPAVSGPQNIQVYNSGGVTLHSDRTISGTVTLTLGTFDNDGSANDKTLTMADGSTISRARGALSVAPTFASTVNLAYTSTVENVTTSFEMPSSSSVLNNLSVTGSQGMTMGSNVTVNGTLSFGGSSGSITSNSNTLTLASAATITGETAGRYVVGNLTATKNVGTAASTLGGIGVSLNSGADDLGNVTVTRVSGSNGIVSANSNTGIARKWTITSDNPPTSGRDLTLSWVSTDDNGKSFSAGNLAQAWKYNGSTWDAVGTPADVTSSRSLTVTTTSFSDWTVSDQSSPLPVELTSFNTSISGKSVTLKWVTASEMNNFGFEIQRRTVNGNDGGKNDVWSKIGFVNGQGSSNTVHEYSFVDNAVNGGQYAYRLKQIDRDGKTSFSNSVEAIIILTPSKYDLTQNYPNPFNPSTTIEYQLPAAGYTTVKVFDMLGKEVAELVAEIKEAGVYQVPFDASKLSSGIYFYQLRSGSHGELKKMILLK